MDFGTLRVTYLGDARPVKQAASEVDRINRQTARNAEANDRLVERSKKTLADVQTREAKRGADAFIRELNRTRQAERQASGGFGGEASSLLGGRAAFLGGGAVAGVGALAAGFVAAAKAGVEYDQTIERLTKSFESLLGSQQAAASHLEDLRRFAAATPFEFEDVARASQRFQNMGLKAADVIPTLRAVGNAVSAAGGGSEEINRVSLALSQMAAKGKVSAEEMNQLAEAGVGGWKLLEQQTGKTKAELFKMAEAGELSADAFLTAFRQAYQSGNQMQRQMETLSGATSTLKDAGKELLGQAFKPLHDTARDIAVELAKMTSEGWNGERAMKALAAAARDFINASNSPWFDKWLILFAAQQGLGGAAAGALGYGPKPPASWGTPNAGWGAVEVPKEFQYKQKISDEDLQKVQNAATRAEKERYVADIFRKQEEARRKAQQEAERGAREAAAAIERQQSAVGELAEHLRDLTIQNNLFNASEVEQQIALMRARSGVEALSGGYRQQAERLLDMTAVQMRLNAAKEEERRVAKATEEVYRQSRQMRLEVLGVERTHTDAVKEFVLASVEQGATLDRIQTKLLYTAAAGRDAAEAVERLAETSDLFKVADFKLPEGPSVDPASVGPAPPNYGEEQARRMEQMREVAYDLSDIFTSVFRGVEDGWRGMWSEMLNIARTTLLDISGDLMRMALTGQKSGAGGIIGLAANWIGGALLGGTSIGGAGSAAGGVISGLGYASGTPSASPGLRWVGERGPELVRFRGGEQVFDSARSQRMAGTVINKTTIINYQPRVTPSSYQSRRSSRETFETLLGFAR